MASSRMSKSQVCVGCKFGDQCLFRHTEAEGQLNQKPKKSGGEGSVALLKESFQLGCVAQDSHPSKSILWKGKFGIKSHRHFSRSTWHHMEIRDRKEELISAGLKNAIRVLQNLRTGHMRNPCKKNDAPAEKHETWRKKSVSSKHVLFGHDLELFETVKVVEDTPACHCASSAKSTDIPMRWPVVKSHI